tara:strand:+ start:13417 stop:14175 length:759 start_codon:yes stop_codon:yes gene_type:complete
MSKLSILDMTQDIASDMNSDEISSITDTIESLQIAQIIKSTYEEMMSRKNWPHLQKLIALDASGTTARPTHMAVPETIKEVVSVSYNKRKLTQTAPRWQEVEYKYPDEFLRITNSRNTDISNTVEITDISGVTLIIKNDSAPTYFTSFDDENIVFDSYDNTVDSTVQASKSQVLAYITPVFTLSDTFVPDLPIEMFSTLLAEAKSTCFTRIKQAADGKAEQQARRGMSWASRKAWQVAGGWRFPDYGRNSKK